LDNVKPISIWKAALLFASTSALIIVAVYLGIPALQRAGFTFLQAYLACFYPPFALILCLAIAVYRLEGNPWSWPAFARRYRLRKMDGKTWLWTAGLVVAGAIIATGLFPVSTWLAGTRWFAPPETFPPNRATDGPGPACTSLLSHLGV